MPGVTSSNASLDSGAKSRLPPCSSERCFAAYLRCPTMRAVPLPWKMASTMRLTFSLRERPCAGKDFG